MTNSTPVAPTPEQARESLLFHCGAHPQTTDPRWEYGFLGMLRPFRGLREENIHDVMRCLRALAPQLQEQRIDRELVSAIWSICHFGRAWGVWPQGLLRRNQLISAQEVARLESWIEMISYAVASILDGNIDEAFLEYDAAGSMAVE